MRKGFGFALMALAAVLAAPAFADMPNGCGSSEPGHGGLGGAHGWILLVDDATREDFQNMTMGELERLKEKKSQELMNMTPAQIEEIRQKKMEERENMTLAELKESMSRAHGKESPCSPMGCPMGEMRGPGFFWGDERGMGPGPNMVHPFLLRDDLTEEELNNMTLAEIKELEQKKTEELNNMTLAEIEELWQQKREELDNTTLKEMKGGWGHPGRRDGPGMGFGPEMWTRGKAECTAPDPGR